MELRRHHIYILIVVLLLGGLLELAKKRVPTIDADRGIHLAFNRIDEKPYARNTDDDAATLPPTAKPNFQGAHFAENNTFSHPAPGPSPSPSPSAAKKDSKKKKKTKKATGVALPTTTQIEGANQANIPNGGALPAAPYATQPPAPPQQPAVITGGNPAENPAAMTLQEWKDKLLNQPDPSATAEFIQDYKEGKVSPQIYYSIAKLMVTDPRSEMQLLGVQVAAAVKTYQSFSILASVVESASDSAAAQQAAHTAITTYASVSNLSTLQTVLSVTTPTTGQVEAAQVIAQIANQVASTLQTTSTGGSNGLTSAQISSDFGPLKTILGQLGKSTSSTTLAASAQQAYSAIENLLPG